MQTGKEDVTPKEQREGQEAELIPGVEAVDVSLYETSYERKVDAALHAQNVALEMKRLERNRKAINELKDRIENASAKLSVARLAKLMDRVDELEEEERLILQRIEAASVNQISSGIVSSSEKRIAPEEILPSPKKPKAPKQQSPMVSDGSLHEVEASSSDELALVGTEEEGEEQQLYDDSNTESFHRRIQEWRLVEKDSSMADAFELPLVRQEINFGPLIPISTSRRNFLAPTFLWGKLLEYQKEGVQWMLDLYSQELGGIVGDEMGLGKTIQLIAAVACLQVSRLLHRPILVVCPATVMRQWIREFYQWWPPMRVFLLHRAGFAGSDDIALEEALKKAIKVGHVIITSYGHLQHHKIGRRLLNTEFELVVLDEGHKIRNPAADITRKCKQLRSTRRFILSGTPIQNNLVELWSLMDFVYPGRLGLLPIFKAEIAVPISAGGYVHASSVQVQTAYRCACMLKDLITPYLLRRLKADVALLNLPTKREQVLFCHLTAYQRALYEHYVTSEDVSAIMAGSKNILAGIDILRKICNHPELLRLEEGETHLSHALADIPVPRDIREISGKMNVLDSVLRHWYDEGGNKVLLFCQTRQMLDLVQAFIESQGYYFLRMDGTTSISSRSALVESFNSSSSKYFLFLLTTRVGGLGINLTGANRVIIYDPDWNPSTDMQARERAWRIGQKRPVTIYRMLTLGTIEEKIYHRQIFKQYLTNRILADPKQTRFFKTSDLYDLFSLGNEPMPDSSETRELLEGRSNASNASNANSSILPPSFPHYHSNGQNVLEGLLQVTGLHSALEHDLLVEKPKREIFLVEKEAERRAADALKAIKRSSLRANIANKKIGKLTGGITTTSILASIQRRNVLLADNEESKDADGYLNLLNDPLMKLVDGLLGLFERHGGECASVTIAEAFAHVTGDDAVAFRRLLRSMASLNHGKWELKREFRR